MIRFLKVLLPDILRLALLVLIGTVLVSTSVPVAEFFHEPALAPWGLFTGGAFYIVALSHVIRRLLFYRLDLQLIAQKACVHPTGAGLVFLGVCLLLAAYVLMFGAMVRA